ncbi:MAG TPA: non-homologous end-joining DNA ligase [Acidimicrobiales bacterium]|nr:non-homologous end-joining DNA ligase [Acidimicrobiales bacterium]
MTPRPRAGARSDEFAAPSPDELDALRSMQGGGRWTCQGRTLELSNLDKVLFPASDGDPAATKRDLLVYYAEMAPVILPYLADRPINLHRFPDGAGNKGFWQKQVPSYAPEWLTRWRYEDADPGRSQDYAVIDSAPSLVWEANMAAIELHAWTSSLRDVREPTWALIDIDPGSQTSFDDVVRLAQLYRAGLEHLGVDSVPKLSGQRGIHIWVPVADGYSFDDTRTWVEALSRAIGAFEPDVVSWTWEKSRRRGRARLDYTQNAINKTLVAPYSVRAAPGAPVSMPITWEELDELDDAAPWTIRTAPARVQEVGDLFAAVRRQPQRLPTL